MGEKAAGILGASMLLGAIGYLAWTGFRHDRRVADPGIRITGMEKASKGYLVRLEIINRGNATARGLKISGKLACEGGETETSEADLQFLPSDASVRCGLFFTRDPMRCDLSLRPEGYAEP